MESQEIIFKDLAEGIEGLNQYFNGSIIEKKVIKSFIKKNKFVQIPYETKRNLYRMFDPSQKVSAEVISKQVELYVELLNESNDKFDVVTEFPAFHEFISSLYLQDISRIGNDRLYVLLNNLKKIKPNKITPEIEEFVNRIPTLYNRNVDNMSNRRLSILIGQIKNEEFDNLAPEIQSFVIALFRRCATKTETSDNNNDRFKTSYWFKDNIQNYFSQFNKAFFGLGLYENSFMDEPTKKIRFKYLSKYADLQYEFIKKLESIADYNNMSVARVLYRNGDTSVYNYASECARDLGIGRFSEYDRNDSAYYNFYLVEPREYKTSVTSKMTGLFSSMIASKLKKASEGRDSEIMAQKLSEFISTRKMNDDLIGIMTKTKDEQDFRKIFLDYGTWLVNLVHLDDISRKSVKELIDPENEIFDEEKKFADEIESRISVQSIIEDKNHDETVSSSSSIKSEYKFESAKPYEQLSVFDLHPVKQKGEE